MNWTAISDKGLVREKNEDALLAYPEIGLFAVADGMGGHLAGEIASKLALKILAEAVYTHSPVDPLPALMAATEQANRQVYTLAVEKEEYGGMGTTLTACFIQAQTLYWAHVGDSRGYLVREGKISQFTRDHSLVSDYVREGKITPEEAETHPYRNVLSRALGTEPTVLADTGKVQLQTGDLLLLCTDGLTLHLADTEIMELVMEGTLVKQAQKLLNLVLERGGKDNVTFILIEINDA
ncbi:MAG: Stp1/IreP family PP2C-type Ser/Thr phosphatase [Ammonifex sp.]|nr:MAG: Stp1/IreP family PP2C-type Ser/Thr phosphatase [Ammonifex sp.]